MNAVDLRRDGLVVEDDRRSVVPDLVGVRRIGGRSDLVVGERIWNCVYDIKGATISRALSQKLDGMSPTTSKTTSLVC